MNVTSFETWMNFNQVLQTEDSMKIVFICFKFVNVCTFLKIGAINCPIKEILESGSCADVPLGVTNVEYV